MKILQKDPNTFEVVGTGEEIDNVKSWLEKTIKKDYLPSGINSKRRKEVWPDDYVEIFFWHEKDSIMFKMVWS